MLRLLIWVAPLMAGVSAAAGPAQKSGTGLDLRVSPLIDLHFYLRWLAERGQNREAPGWCKEAVGAVEKLDAELAHSALAWWVIEVRLYGCESAADAAKALTDLPESYAFNDRGKQRNIELRKLGTALANGYAAAEPEFLSSVWPQHRTRVEAAANLIGERLVPKAPESFAYMLEHLGIADPKLTIPVYITAEGPSPGAVTHRRDGTESVCFVAATAAEGTQLLEVVLHESTHGLDIADDGNSVFEALRRKLEAAGVTRRDRAWRDVPHTVMFVQAAETIRRIVDPEHRDYGDAGYYGRVPDATAAVRPAWKAHLDGKITRDEAVARMVAPFTKPTAQSPTKEADRP